MRETFARFKFDFEEFIDAGDQVAVVGTFQTRGRASGVETQRTEAQVWTIRSDKALRFEWGLDRATAMQVLGLAE